MNRRESLAGQVVAVNVLLVVATLFAASAAASLDLEVTDERGRFLLLAMTIVLVLLVNMLMLRRRFSPLERLIAQVEAIDPAAPAAFEPVSQRGAVEEVERLGRSFRALLERVEDERRRAGRLVLRAQEEERKRVARDLHDEVNQALTAILLRLEALSHDAPPALSAHIGELKLLTNQAMEELLMLARQLRPTALDDHGLVSAIDGQVRRFEEQTGIRASFQSRIEPRALGEDEQVVLSRVAQEALSNAARHSAAERVDVDLAPTAGGVELTVRDDGRGFDPQRRTDRLGLSGMAERARSVGGELAIDSEPGRGAAVILRVLTC